MVHARRTPVVQGRKAPGRRRGILSLALWFGLGLLAAGPLNLAVGALRGTGGSPKGTAGGAAIPSARPPAGFGELIQKGFDLLSAERHDRAFEEFQRAAALGPSEPEPYLGLAEVYRKLQLHSLAEESYRKAIRLDATCWPAKEALVKILCDRGRNEEAIAILKELERDTPDASFVWGELALNTLRLGRPAEAIPWLERYTRAEKDQAWGFAHLGRAHAELGQNQEAERALREAVEKDPKMGLAHLWLGQVLVTTGRKAEGDEHLKAFHDLQHIGTMVQRLEGQVGREPENVKALVQLAHGRGLLGQYARALVPLERAIALSPGDERLSKMRQGLLARIEAGKKVGKAP